MGEYFDFWMHSGATSVSKRTPSQPAGGCGDYFKFGKFWFNLNNFLNYTNNFKICEIDPLQSEVELEVGLRMGSYKTNSKFDLPDFLKRST